MPTLAIAILNWNGQHFLAQFLPSVVALSKTTSLETTIYVIDNASTDSSTNFVHQSYPDVKVVQNDGNYGFAEGYNRGLRSIEADYFLLLNSDVEVTEGWIAPLVNLMETDPTIFACQPKILAFHRRTHFEYAGAAGGWLDRFGYAFCRGRFFERCEEDRGQYDAVRETAWATGAAMLVRADVFTNLGGFDGDFFAHMEEIDLCWRAKRAGYRVMCCPQSVVYHVGGGTLPQGNPRKLYLNFRNNLAMLFKNLTTSELITVLLPRLGLDAVAAVQALLTGNFINARTIIRADADFLRRLPFWWKKRKEVAKTVERNRIASPNRVGFYKGSIIVDHFLRGKEVAPLVR